MQMAHLGLGVIAVLCAHLICRVLFRHITEYFTVNLIVIWSGLGLYTFQED